MLTPLNDKIAWQWLFCDRYSNRKTMFPMGFFAVRWFGPCFTDCLFTRRQSLQLIVGSQNGSPLFSRPMLRKTVIAKWPPYGGSSQNDQVFPPLERINWFSMYSNGEIVLAWQFRCTISSSCGAPLYILNYWGFFHQFSVSAAAP